MNIAERAFIATRTLGMHPFGHLLGIWCQPPEAGECIGNVNVTSISLDEHDEVAIGVLATLGDMAMQTSLISVYPDERWTTLLLAVRRFSPIKDGGVHIASSLCHADQEVGLVRATVRDDYGNPTGDVCGTFVRVPVPSDWRPLPWEIGLGRPEHIKASDEIVFSQEEIAEIKALNAQLKNGAARFSELIQIGEPYHHHGSQWRLSWSPKSHLRNRASEAQGGAIYSALALASNLVAPKTAILIEQKVEFFKPVKDKVVIEVELLREGRRFTSIITRMLDSDDRPLAVGWSQYRT